MAAKGIRGIREIEIGTKINLFTVINYDEKVRKYILQCACGNIARHNSHHIKYALRENKLKGCAKCTRHFVRPNMRLPDYEGAKRNVYGNYHQAAKRRKYSFELSEEDFFKMIIQDCFYCGEQPNMTLGHKNRKSYDGFKFNGIDRIDNAIGYTLKNCVPCCKICNNSKSTLSKQAWFEWLKKVTKYSMLV